LENTTKNDILGITWDVGLFVYVGNHTGGRTEENADKPTEIEKFLSVAFGFG
jgi:hypothetical protein